jgi:hypothetical protein
VLEWELAMDQSFSLAQHRCTVVSDPALREEIQARTENAIATTRILSAIDRFGSDPSIVRFEMTPKTHMSQRPRDRVSWSVRAVRRSADGSTSP